MMMTAAQVAAQLGMRLGEMYACHVQSGAIVLLDSKNGTARAIPAHPRIRHLLRWLPLMGLGAGLPG